MSSFTLLGGSIIVVLAMIKDYNGTIKLVTAVISIRGVTWLCKKITESINKGNSEIINFAGWSIAGLSIVPIIHNAMEGFKPISESFARAGESINRIEMFFGNIAQFVDKLTFWN